MCVIRKAQDTLGFTNINTKDHQPTDRKQIMSFISHKLTIESFDPTAMKRPVGSSGKVWGGVTMKRPVGSSGKVWGGVNIK